MDEKHSAYRETRQRKTVHKESLKPQVISHVNDVANTYLCTQSKGDNLPHFWELNPPLRDFI